MPIALNFPVLKLQSEPIRAKGCGSRYVVRLLGNFCGMPRGLVFPVIGLLLSAHTVSAATAPIPMPPGSAPTRIIFHDAQLLAALLSSGNPECQQVNRVLQEWGYTADTVNTNPFLSQLPIDRARLKTAACVPGRSQQPPTAAVGPGAGISSIVTNGIADFIAERVEQEAEITFILSFKKFVIANGPGWHLGSLFPRTYALFRDLKLRQVAEADFLGTFHATAAGDLSDLPGNLTVLIDSLNGSQAMDASALAIHVVVRVGQEAVDKQPAYSLIEAMQQEGEYDQARLGSDAKQMYGAIELLTIASHVLTKDKRTAWYGSEEFQSALEGHGARDEAIMADALLGLSYSEDAGLWSDLNSQIGGGLVQLLNGTGRQQFIDFLKAVIGVLDRIRIDESMLSGKVTVSQLRALTLDFASLMKLMGQCAAISPHLEVDVGKLKLYLNHLSTIEEIVGSVQNDQYESLAINLCDLLEAWWPNDAGARGLVGFLQGDGALIIAMAQAKDAAAAQAVLDTYALPAGGYLEKEIWPFTVTLNAYFGAAYGHERLLGNLSDTSAPRYGPRVGFTAPVGVAFNWAVPQGKWANKHLYIGDASAFISVVDVGALASWRLGHSASKAPSVTWANVVAPGVFGVIGLRDLPVSLILGTEYGPGLRSVNGTAGTTQVEKSTWQLPLVGVVFDIPIKALSWSGREIDDQ